MESVICFRRADGRDYGGNIADILGLKKLDVAIDQWRQLSSPEPEFIVSDGVGAEVHFSPPGGATFRKAPNDRLSWRQSLGL